jgi:hypothetical protein
VLITTNYLPGDCIDKLDAEEEVSKKGMPGGV